jgi:hypothetical protein
MPSTRGFIAFRTTNFPLYTVSTDIIYLIERKHFFGTGSGLRSNTTFEDL